MAEGKKISELNEVSSVTDSDEFIFVDKEGTGSDSGTGGKTAKITFANLKSAIGPVGQKGEAGEKGDKGDLGPQGSPGEGADSYWSTGSVADTIGYLGRVGIGTTEPNLSTNGLHIQGPAHAMIQVEGLTGNSMIGLGNPTDLTGSYTIKHDTSGDVNFLRISTVNAVNQGGGMTLTNNDLAVAGKIGIGSHGVNSNPGELLHLATSELQCGLTLHSETKQAKLVANNAGTLSLKAGNGGNSPDAKMVFEVNDVEAMRIRPDGNVGIGAGSRNPASKLDVSGQAYLHDNVDGRAPLYVKQDGTGPSAYFIGGNVGIGTTNPDSVLTINHVHPQIRFEDADGDPAHVTQVGSYNGAMYFDCDMANPINTEGRTTGKGFVFRTDANTTETPSGNELLVINQNGNVGIGTSSPSRKLTIEGDIPKDVQGNSGGMLRLVNTSTDANPEAVIELMTQSGANCQIVSRQTTGSSSADSRSDLIFKIKKPNTEGGVKETLKLKSEGGASLWNDKLGGYDNVVTYHGGAGSLMTDGGQNGLLKTIPFQYNILPQSDGKPRRYCIYKMQIDTNDWASTGRTEIELFEQYYYGMGLKKYSIEFSAYNNGAKPEVILLDWNGSGLYSYYDVVTEWVDLGDDGNNGGRIYEMSVFVRVKNYARVSVQVKTNAHIVDGTNNTLSKGEMVLGNRNPLSTENIEDFTVQSEQFTNHQVVRFNRSFDTNLMSSRRQMTVAPGEYAEIYYRYGGILQLYVAESDATSNWKSTTLSICGNQANGILSASELSSSENNFTGTYSLSTPGTNSNMRITNTGSQNLNFLWAYLGVA